MEVLMRHGRWLWFLFRVTALVATACALQAQDKNYLAIIPPFHDRQQQSASEGMLQLTTQRFVLFVYRNAVAVYSEAEFLNTGGDSMVQELALPSTGHSETGKGADGRVSNGILSVQIWVEGERSAPAFFSEGDGDWCSIRARFAPGEARTVKALFWAQTSLTDVDAMPGNDTTVIVDGKRGLMVDLSHATIWKGVMQSIEVRAILKEGLAPGSPLFSADPGTYDLEDSTLTWEMRNIECSTSDNITLGYMSSERQNPRFNTMAALSKYIVTTGYGELLDFARKMSEE